VWWVAHRSIIHAVARSLTTGLSRPARVYLKGGFGFGQPVYGLSDVDMIVVTEEEPARPGVNRERVGRRWQRLIRQLPTLAELYGGRLWTYDRAEARALARDTYLTFGLSDSKSAFFGRESPQDPMGLLDHPGLYGPQRDWRRLGSSEQAPEPISDESARGVFAWLELRFLWGYAFLLSLDLSPPSAASTCVKLVADSARIWLWLGFGEQVFRRDDLLARAIERMPDEEEALRFALELGRSLSRRPEPPLARVLPFLLRTSTRVAEHLATSAGKQGTTEVALAWDGPDQLLLGEDVVPRTHGLGSPARLLALGDWRARAIPSVLDAAMALFPGDPAAPELLAALARAADDGLLPAVRHGELLIVPTTDAWERGRLRGVECRVTDPVSMALIDGSSSASFPNLRGWSACDSARRALAEHAAWLDRYEPGEDAVPAAWLAGSADPALVALGGLFTAARAALFAESLDSGVPELALTAAAITDRMSRYGVSAQSASEAALELLVHSRRGAQPPDWALLGAFHEVVQALPAYASPTKLSGDGALH
jgi:hypothetical protein